MAIVNLSGFSSVALSAWRKANPGSRAPKNGDIVSLQFNTWESPREYRAQWFGTPSKGMRLYWNRVQPVAAPNPAEASVA